MSEKCFFCGESAVLTSLANNMFELIYIMEAYEMDLNRTKDSLACKDCLFILSFFYDYKKGFMNRENEVKQYARLHSKANVNLIELLVSMGKYDVATASEITGVCRICLSCTRQDLYKEIRSGDSGLARVFSACFPQAAIVLTVKTHICPDCDSKLLKCYHFLLSCLEAIKPKKRTDPVEKKRPGRPASTVRKRTRRYFSTSAINKKMATASPWMLFYQCHICPKGARQEFPSQAAIEKHIQTHKNDLTFNCWECDMVAFSLELLKKHLQTHGYGECYILIEQWYEAKPKRHTDDSFNSEETVKLGSDSKCLRCGKNPFGPNCSCNWPFYHAADYFRCRDCKFKTSILRMIKLHYKHTHRIIPDAAANFDSSSQHEHSQNPPSDTNNEDEFCCGHCLKTYQTLDDLDTHTCRLSSSKSESNSSITPATAQQFKCIICSLKFETNAELEQHTCSNPANDETKCSRCQETFESKQLLFTHACQKSLKIVKREDGCYECTKCSVTKELLEEITLHECYQIDNNHLDNDELIKCEEELDVKSEIAEEKSEEVDAKEVLRKVAEMMGVKVDKNGLVIDQEAHVKQNCLGCERMFEEKELFYHKNYCKKVKQCPLCVFVTNSAQDLQIHCYTLHDILFYVCPLCRFSTLIKENFNNHCVQTHPDYSLEDWLDIENDESELDDFQMPVISEVVGAISQSEETIESEKLQEICTSSNTVVECTSEVVSIDSDSDSEFVETANVVVVNERCDINADDASQLISQGVPVFRESHLVSRVPVIESQEIEAAQKRSGGPIILNDVIIKNASKSVVENGDVQVLEVSEENGDNENDDMVVMNIETGSSCGNQDKCTESFTISNAETTDEIFTSIDAQESLILSDDQDSSIQTTEVLQEEVATTPPLDPHPIKKSKKRYMLSTLRDNCIVVHDDDSATIEPIKMNETSEAMSSDDDDDCVVVTPQQQSKPKKTMWDYKRPPTAYHLFSQKVRREIENKYPNLKKKPNLIEIANAWRNMSAKDKWPFMEEARLHKLLHMQEHAELVKSPKRKKRYQMVPRESSILDNTQSDDDNHASSDNQDGQIVVDLGDKTQTDNSNACSEKEDETIVLD